MPGLSGVRGVCPSGVQYGRLVETARTQIERARPRALAQRWLRWFIFALVFQDMRLFRAASRLLWFYQRSGVQWLARRLGLLKLLRLSKTEALLPTLPIRFLKPRGQIVPPTWEWPGQRPARVALFTGCVMSTAFAETDRATARVLAANGCEVHLRRARVAAAH